MGVQKGRHGSTWKRIRCKSYARSYNKKNVYLHKNLLKIPGTLKIRNRKIYSLRSIKKQSVYLKIVNKDYSFLNFLDE